MRVPDGRIKNPGKKCLFFRLPMLWTKQNLASDLKSTLFFVALIFLAGAGNARAGWQDKKSGKEVPIFPSANAVDETKPGVRSEKHIIFCRIDIPCGRGECACRMAG